MAHVLVLCAHPDLRQSRVNRSLLKAARETAAAPSGGNTFEVRDLYALYPDYVIDVAAEQQQAARADLIVWQHPVHWYAMPPLMKLWLDDVLTLGWAYGPSANDAEAALRGKDLWLVLSTGGSDEAYRPDGYNRYFFDAFLPPYEQTAALCGMRFLPPLVLHGAHGVRPEAVAEHVARFREHLMSYPAWPEMGEVEACPECVVPVGERPSEAVAAEEVVPLSAAAGIAPWLTGSLVFLGAAVIAVPLSKALGLGSIIGYLAAGLLIGPFGLGLVSDPETILHFAEFGVVLMLFLVGLELEPARLWALRRPIFGWGALQVVACAVAIGLVAVLAGAPWKWAVVGALGLALSSTAIALQVLAERNLLPTTSGQAGFSILLFQDVAAIPILALIPVLGVREEAGGSAWIEAARAIGVIVAIVLGGRLLLRPLFRWIAKSRTPEIFTAAALLLVVGIAALMQWVGLSMALGAFLGGVLLAESEYKRELETDIEPFKGLLLGLFFIAVGMSVDFDALLAHPGIVFGVLVGFLGLKLVVLWALARGMGIPWQERPVFTLLLAQGGEFAFVVYQAATTAQVFGSEVGSVLIGAVALSMLVTPLLLVFIDRVVMPRYASKSRVDMDEISEPQDAPVIVAGFGRYGQIVTRLLVANGIQPTVLELDADQIEVLRRFGFTVYYGDATRLDLLRTAGAGKAKVLVVAIDDVAQSLKVVDIAREHFPHLKIVARARNVQHWYDLRERGVQHAEREIFDSSLVTARSVLELMGWEPHRARTLAMRFRRHNLDQLEEMLPHRKDQAKVVSMAKAGRQQLEELFAQDRADREERRREGWGE